MENTQSSENYKKVGFDARLKYHDVIKQYFDALGLGEVNGDYRLQLRACEGLFFKIRPYIKSEDVKIIRKHINTCRNYLAQSNQHPQLHTKFMDLLDQKLFDLKDRIHMAGQTIWLPTKGDDDNEDILETLERES